MNLRKQEIYLSKRSMLITYFLSFGQGADVKKHKKKKKSFSHSSQLRFVATDCLYRAFGCLEGMKLLTKMYLPKNPAAKDRRTIVANIRLIDVRLKSEKEEDKKV